MTFQLDGNDETHHVGKYLWFISRCTPFAKHVIPEHMAKSFPKLLLQYIMVKHVPNARSYYLQARELLVLGIYPIYRKL